MTEFDETRIKALTRREHECLRMLGAGLQTGEVAARLCISTSTLNAHLASARRKLGVRSTALALLAIQSSTLPVRGGAGTVVPVGATNPVVDFCDRLRACTTLADAHCQLEAFLAPLGVVGVNFGVVADPSNPIGAPISTKFSPQFEIAKLYYSSGGPMADPTTWHAVRSVQPLSLDPELDYQLLKQAPKGGKILAEALIDMRINRIIALPGRDQPTRAPYSLNVTYAYCTPREYRAAIKSHLELLQSVKEVFWNFVQERSLLSDEPRLTDRERDVLLLLARGYRLSEMAEQLGMSRRRVEALLARTRHKLRARTNSQALYRAIVFRAL